MWREWREGGGGHGCRGEGLRLSRGGGGRGRMGGEEGGRASHRDTRVPGRENKGRRTQGRLSRAACCSPGG